MLEREIGKTAETVTELAEAVKDVATAAETAGRDYALKEAEAQDMASRVLQVLRALRKIPETVADLGPAASCSSPTRPSTARSTSPASAT